MPEPHAHPDLPHTLRVARWALGAGAALVVLKFAIFFLTNSAAVLSDALESIINVVAAAFMLYSLWLSGRPADRSHPYGHGKVEFFAVGLEGAMILMAALIIAYEAVRRLIARPELQHLDWGIGLLAGVGALSAALALYVLYAGRKYQNAVLLADGKHLLTDVASTVAVVGGLILIHWTGWHWIDPLIAMAVAGLILFISWKLLWKSIDGLMDRVNPGDDRQIRQILDEEQEAGTIHGYHKLRHRRAGSFLWADVHLQVDGAMSVEQGHRIASHVEHRIEEALGHANATAHVEPAHAAGGAGESPVAGEIGAEPSERPPAGPSEGPQAAPSDGHQKMR